MSSGTSNCAWLNLISILRFVSLPGATDGDTSPSKIGAREGSYRISCVIERDVEKRVIVKNLDHSDIRAADLEIAHKKIDQVSRIDTSVFTNADEQRGKLFGFGYVLSQRLLEEIRHKVGA